MKKPYYILFGHGWERLVTMQSILIVGANGFVGKNLKEYFENSSAYQVLCPGKEELNAIEEDSVKNYLHRHAVDTILHTAIYNPRAGYGKNAQKELEYDLRMFFNFEKYSALYGRMFYFGSGAEYDKRSPLVQICEEDGNRSIPIGDYGFAKYIIGRQILKSKNIYNLRIFGLFGKYENWRTTFISGACCKALKGLPITIRQNVYFDYLYIHDFCRLVETFMNKELQHKEYNLVSGKRVDLLTLARLVCQISGKELPIYVCKEGLACEYTASNARILEEIGEFAYTPVDTAVRELYEWYQGQEEMIDLLSLLYP